MWWWAFLLGCSCNDPAEPSATPASGRVKPAKILATPDPAKLANYPKCVSYADAVCEVCGAATEACVTIRKVNAVCSDRGTCQESSCERGEKRLRSDPKGADSELCTE